LGTLHGGCAGDPGTSTSFYPHGLPVRRAIPRSTDCSSDIPNFRYVVISESSAAHFAASIRK
jgi:hypothetical protein